MAYCPAARPGIDDTFTIYVMAFTDGETRSNPQRQAERERLQAMLPVLPPSQNPPLDWGPWICLWVGGRHTIRKFNDNDAKAIADLLLAAEKAIGAMLFEPDR